MRSLYLPILCLVFLRVGVLSSAGDEEELKNDNLIDEIFNDLKDNIYEGVEDQDIDASLAATCTEKYSCKDCMSLSYINATCFEEVILNCTAGTACFTAPDGSYNYCAAHTSTDCACGSTPQQCDFYNSNNTLYCSSNGPFLSEPCPTGQVCSAGACTSTGTGDNGTTPTVPPSGEYDCVGNKGWVLEAPECQNAIYCKDGVQLDNTACLSGEYFDPILGCQPAPPEKCGDNCAGFCPDKVDCQKFYICDGSGGVVGHEDCEPGLYFNPEAVPPKCESQNTNCPPTSVCTAYTESPDATTVPITPSVSVDPTAPVTQSSDSGSSNSPGTTFDPTGVTCNEDTVGTYEYPPDCTMYVWCQETSPGNFEVTVRQCWGDLAYNPVIGGCDYPENVPGCTVKTS